MGQFDLVGITPAPRGVPQIEVTFDIDANGIVHVSAKDKATGKEQQIKIQASGGLSDSDIDKMVKEAEANAETDKLRRETVEAKNQGESLVHATEKSLEELGDKVPADEQDKVKAAIDDLKTALEGENKGDIEAKTQALTEASMKLGEIAYKQAQEENAAQEPGADDVTPGDDDAVEAEVMDADFTDLEIEDDEDAAKSA